MIGSLRLSTSLLSFLLICGLGFAQQYGQYGGQQQQPAYQPSQNYGSYGAPQAPVYTVSDCFATMPNCKVDETSNQPYYTNTVASASDCAQTCLDHNKQGVWYNGTGTTQTVYCQAAVFKENYVCKLYHQNNIVNSVSNNQPGSNYGRKRRQSYGAQPSYSAPAANYGGSGGNTGGYGGGSNNYDQNNDVCQFLRPNCPGYGQSGAGVAPTAGPATAAPTTAGATTVAGPSSGCYTPGPDTRTMLGNALEAYEAPGGFDGTNKKCQDLCTSNSKCLAYNFYKADGPGNPAECILHDKTCTNRSELCALDATTEYHEKKDKCP